MIAVPVAAVAAVFLYVGLPIHGSHTNGVAATYLLEEHAAVASDNPLADRGLIVPASMVDSQRSTGLMDAGDTASGQASDPITMPPTAAVCAPPDGAGVAQRRFRGTQPRAGRGFGLPIPTPSCAKRSMRRATCRTSARCKRSAGAHASRAPRFSAWSTSRPRVRAARSSRPEALYGEYDITLGTTTTKIDPKQHRAMVSENPSSDNRDRHEHQHRTAGGKLSRLSSARSKSSRRGPPPRSRSSTNFPANA